jgi:hypothetical protein
VPVPTQVRRDGIKAVTLRWLADDPYEVNREAVAFESKSYRNGPHGFRDPGSRPRHFAMETLSATSLEVVRESARAAEAMSESRFDEARQSFSRAVALDPDF